MVVIDYIRNVIVAVCNWLHM